ncbi:MAG: agmatine deiminase family protein [Thermoanaerobaculia bacterium]
MISPIAIAGRSRSPRALGYRQPAEWDNHAACWLAWPSHRDLWGDALEPVREAFVALCRAVSCGTAGERLEILVPDEANRLLAAEALAGVPVRLRDIPFGDIWLRDTAPIFLKGDSGSVVPACFAFNGWGGKYVLPEDDQVARRIAELQPEAPFLFSWVLEGGSVEVDGEGTCLTTTQCLLNPNRNPGIDRATLDELLGEALGVTKVLWLGDGLKNDHTDGHIDTIARFAAPGRVVCMEASGEDDPNREVLQAIVRDLSRFEDAAGRRLDVTTVPSPGRILSSSGEVMPASYVNFYVGNAAVVVPTYGSSFDDEAVEKIAALFPGRRTVGVSARELLEGGGAFHCISQQQPEAAGRTM